MKALIKDNKVCDVVENEFPVTDEFTWVDCDNTVKQGFSYDGSTFTSNLPTEEEEAQKQAELQADMDLRNSAKAKLVAGTPLTEEEAEKIVL